MKSTYNPINFELYKGLPAQIFSKKRTNLNKSRLLRMFKLDVKSNNDYNIINGKYRKRPKIPTEFMDQMNESVY
jgi:hypothetical protein